MGSIIFVRRQDRRNQSDLHAQRCVRNVITKYSARLASAEELLIDGLYLAKIRTHQDFFPRASERRVLPIVGVCKTSSHLHILSSSHLLIFTSSHLHILSSSHPLIFASSHLHIFTSSHLLIFTSSHLHIFSSSHLLIFTSSHLHIFSTSSHIFSHLLTSSHIFSHLLTSSHIFSHLLTSSHIFSHLLTSSHLLHIFSHLLTSSHIFSHLLTSSHLYISSHTFSSCPLALSFFSISLLKAGAGAVPTRRHETQPFRTK